MEIVGWLSVLIGVVLLTWSSRIVNLANAGRQVPYWTKPDETPKRSIWMRVLGVFFLLVGVFMFTATLGYWSVAVVLAGFAPGTALIALHNRQLATPA
ncbi:hypothetical protein [Microbacterium lushaniae]|uniref:Uncharacterized protein n=1 Tax=Microbacterium lushaniae TaxID=2614639 RepID=A0A5J6L4N2_9MICO|nr:hypothetical protein [Microbacterium lushaniae]QEW03494.1 hypothetical protein F6J85_10535 [Microbacterium lushaniae]